MKCNKPAVLLVVEDSDEDFEALNRIIAQICTFPLTVHRCISGDDALDFLNMEGEYQNFTDILPPGLILLDLNLPGTDGREVLGMIKKSATLKTIPVIVISTSSNPKDIEDCYQSGVNSYMLKPMNISELKISIQMMLDYWFKVAILPADIAPATINKVGTQYVR
jgi:CheY-like chemotaxis protein